MDAPQIAAGIPAAARPDSPAGPLLQGRRLMVARVAWGTLVALALGLVLAAVPAVYLHLSAPPEAVGASLARRGLPIRAYAAYLTALQVIFGLCHFAIAGLIARRKSDDGPALFVSLFLVLIGAANPPNVVALAALLPGLVVPVTIARLLLDTSLILFFYLFPDGRFVPRRAALPVFVGIAAVLATAILPGNSLEGPSNVAGLLLLGGLAGGVIAQVYRYRRVSDPVQRQQTKWVVFGAAAAVAGQFVFALLAPWLPSIVPPDLRATPYDATSVTGITVAFLLIPLTIGVAILRYRLWDIDVIISRTLVYGALTASVVAIYVAIVGGLGALLQARGNPLLVLVAAGLVAVLCQPLRERLQRGVNRIMYGERDEPYAVLSRLGQRLEGTLAPDAVLAALVQTVREALKLPYAAITLKEAGGTGEAGEGATSGVAAASGVPATGGELCLPLMHQGEPVGELVLAPRAPGEDFSPADRRLLADLARQAGIAAHAVLLHERTARLAADLQQAREGLVATREEERRRLRRDLHDGLGPQLAGFTIRLDVVRHLLRHDPDGAEAVVLELKACSQAVVADIRRLVYALRPPALDELGLVAALRQQAAQYEHNGLVLTVDAPEALPPLPAAVEVAAYRIAQEALTNVARHAQAQTCALRIALDEQAGALRLEVSDDGQGLPAPPAGSPRDAGVGLVSMRERAVELGGSCVIEPRRGGGTRVAVRLPTSRRDARDGGDEAGPRNAAEAGHGQ